LPAPPGSVTEPGAGAPGPKLATRYASTVSAFAICNQVVSNCTDPNSPDGSVTAVAGSPFSTGIAPVAMLVAPSGKFLFVVNRQSNQISEFKIATGTGVLTTNAQPSISTGSNPVGITFRAGTTTWILGASEAWNAKAF
jgi:hypothetical protein